MGQFMKEYDVYIDSLLDLLNLRFAPSDDFKEDWLGGLGEMVTLQKSFKIFQKGRSFRDSCAILDLGGFWDGHAKYKWFKLLEWLDTVESSVRGKKGGPAIVDAIIANLASDNPQPMYFQAHDMRMLDADRVTITGNTKPVFYIETNYITISLPMKPKTQTRPAKKRR